MIFGSRVDSHRALIWRSERGHSALEHHAFGLKRFAPKPERVKML